MRNDHQTTVGAHLATRLAEANLKHFFTVPGDFNLVLLDELLGESRLSMVGCCNELNAGYAADGYARIAGFSAVVFTYTVGGLSLINAAAGAYSDDLPVLFISGGPNSNDAATHHRLHHTTGEYDFDQVGRCFEPVVEEVFIVRHLADAQRMIDQALITCLGKRKPVYLEISCNLANLPLPPSSPISLPPPAPASDPKALEAAISAAAARINSAVKPVLIAGVKLRCADARDAFLKLADALGCAVATMPDAKGLFPESHNAFMGTYWGCVSSLNCSEVVESSDCQIFAGPMFNDYTTTGWTTLLNQSHRIQAGIDFVELTQGHFEGVQLKDFLEGLAERVERKPASLEAYRRFRENVVIEAQAAAPSQPLTIRELRRQIQELLTPETDVVIETGDSWFNGQRFHLPDGATYHFQMQYGSIGWATGACLGVAMGQSADRRTVAMIGDGSFQLTAQEVSTMIRYGKNPIIFLINNRGYTIEVEIHDGPYNNIKNWDYAGLVNVFNAEDGNGLGINVATAGELEEAIKKAKGHDGLVLIECAIGRDDCTCELLEWGSRVSAANGRPPSRLV